MTDPGTYERIGRGYAQTRRADPRIASRIHAALDPALTVVNVGAGTGSYEPADRRVVAVEPAEAMLAQRPADAAPAVRAVAEALPFADATFDAALATLTLHHWSDLARGLAELRRVARRQVILLFEPSLLDTFWLLDYFPEISAVPSEARAPSVEVCGDHLSIVSVAPVPVPADCVDGFGAAFWNRPEAYLDPTVRAGMSSFAQLPLDASRRGVERLRHDLDSGAWDVRNGHLRRQSEHDIGYRLVVAGE